MFDVEESEQEQDSKLIHIGLHMHKCAGMTLQDHFEKCDVEGRRFRHTNALINYNLSRPDIEECNTPSQRSVKIIWGHHIYDYLMAMWPRRQAFLFTFLRHPVSRIVSWYKYNANLRLNRTGSLESYRSFDDYAVKKSNSMCHFILERFPNLVSSDSDALHDRAISVLDKFGFIGLQEDFTTSANNLMNFLELPPLPEENRVNTDRNRIEVNYDSKVIEELNESDLLLYKYATERYQKSPNPDPSRLIDPKSIFSKSQKESFRGFVNIRAEHLTSTIESAKKQEDYCADNLRRMVFLLIRQCFAETDPNKAIFYQKVLLDFVEEFDIDLEKKDIRKIKNLKQIRKTMRLEGLKSGKKSVVPIP